MRSQPSWRTLLTAAAAVTLLPAAAWAIQPEQWSHTSEADFQPGETEQTVVTNLGDLKLATGSEVIGSIPEQASIIYDLQALADGSVYLAAGPEARLLRRSGDEVVEVAELAGEQVFALDVYQGQLLVAISGEGSSRLALLEEGGELRTIAELPDVRYIWDTLVRQGEVVLATGTEGQVLAVQPAEGEGADPAAVAPRVLLDAEQANVLCLALSPRDFETLYAGTDTDGLIYRLRNLDGEAVETFVVYDAPEPEIGALLVTRDGVLFAGTADAEQARPGRLGEAVSEPAGRPEAPIPVDVPEEAPEPGDLPQVPPSAEPIGDEDEGEAPGAPDSPEAGDEATPPAEEEAPEAPAPAPGEGDEGDVEEIDEPAPAPMAVDEADAAQAEAPAEAAPAPAPGAAPTPEQRDRLRSAIRSRLQAARESGQLQVSPGQLQARNGSRGGQAASRVQPVQRNGAQQEGNAIYRIDPQGFVSEVFRESVMILQIVPANGRLLVTTGNEGQVYLVSPRADETTLLADLDAEQVPAVLASPGEGVLLGTANPAQLVRLSDRFAPTGTYTSPVLDAGQISLWGALNLTASLPQGTSVILETRSGNVADPELAPWSAWTQSQVVMPDEAASALQPRSLSVEAPPARFVQYRLTLTGDQATTPVVDRVELAYVTPNLAPRIASIQAAYPEASTRPGTNGAAEGPSSTMTIEWEASDPNEDELVYSLHYRPAGSPLFLPLTEDVQETSYEWQTRRVPDGRYVVRVTASDRRNNPGDMAETATRTSDPVLVDNTPPVLNDLRHEPTGEGLKLAATAVDELSAIRAIAYSVDDEEAYHPVLPEDLIFDSTREAWEITIPDLAPGPHVVTLRVRDGRGNERYQAVLLDVPAQR